MVKTNINTGYLRYCVLRLYSKVGIRCWVVFGVLILESVTADLIDSPNSIQHREC